MSRAAACVVVALLASGRVARTDPATPDAVPPEARALAARGRALHDAGDYRRAIAAFAGAYAIAPSPGLLFNLAQASRLNGDCAGARGLYRRFLATGPHAEARALAHTHLKAVERCARARAGPPRFATPATTPATTLPETTGTAPDGRWHRVAGLGLGVAGGVALWAAVAHGFQARAASREREDAYDLGVKRPELRALDERVDRSTHLAKLYALGGGLAIAGGVTLYLLGRRADRAAAVTITPANGGAGVSWAWEF